MKILANTKILFLSDDLSVRNSIKEKFVKLFEEVKFTSSYEEALKLSLTNNYDLAIVDIDLKNSSFSELSSKLIVISSSHSNEKVLTAINLEAYTFLVKPLNLIDLKLAILMCLNQMKRVDKIEFDQGIYFDEYRDQFFKKDGEMIDFTKLEKSFLKLLIARRNKITDYDMVKDIVWKGKEMSIYTMRNIVNKIRQKTYYEIIKNHSSKGYILNYKQVL
ncbi:response regulator transcription factor [Arcobacter lacus]|uniref:DNA-binding response regulator n=1 Tax=Arcobacter lacus TaxID=1912876 RepID=A0ABX5JIU0_9BACT|nr:response regulator transcription factor [Arcobacter lacus]PUE67067.1 DNA-binding response regulator [Arcobacter lacus]